MLRRASRNGLPVGMGRCAAADGCEEGAEALDADPAAADGKHGQNHERDGMDLGLSW